jgi:hypothetical protein
MPWVARLAATREYVDCWEAVDSVGAIDNPPFLGEVAAREEVAQLVRVPAPGWCYGVIERDRGAGCIG